MLLSGPLIIVALLWCWLAQSLSEGSAANPWGGSRSSDTLFGESIVPVGSQGARGQREPPPFHVVVVSGWRSSLSIFRPRNSRPARHTVSLSLSNKDPASLWERPFRKATLEHGGGRTLERAFCLELGDLCWNLRCWSYNILTSGKPHPLTEPSVPFTWGESPWTSFAEYVSTWCGTAISTGHWEPHLSWGLPWGGCAR